MKKILTLLLLFCLFFITDAKEGINGPAKHKAQIGQCVKASDGSLTITCVNKRGYHSGKYHDSDIQSPKSATFSPDGKKIYINSLEGGKTVVYDANNLEKLKVISHTFTSGNSSVWIKPSGFYPFKHYNDGATRPFLGKPVEAVFSKDGKWLIVPYYRRSFDINAQDPSAIAIIDTESDSIVAMAETGPLPKIVRVSNDGKTLVITHWGDNTVGLMDISDTDPHKWKHLPPIAIGHKLNLDYSLHNPVNRDSGSGNLLRGTLFLPGDSLMLVGGMAAQTAVVDVKRHIWIGYIPSLISVRHIAMRNGIVYFSQNTAGQVLSIPADSLTNAITRQRGASRSFSVGGMRRCAVGGGARTLEPSPSGKYLFVACNSASSVYVVRTSDMTVIAHIPADSFPVGLDISPDGSLLTTTSQGRKDHGGGNAVNFFKIEYAEPEPDLADAFLRSQSPESAELTTATDSIEAFAENQRDTSGYVRKFLTSLRFREIATGISAVTLVILIIILTILLRRKKH